MPVGSAPLRISVALCTHNGAAYVRQQVDSILAQTRPIDEIVLSDDASSDDTVELVRRAVRVAIGLGGNVDLKVLRNKKALGVVRNFEQAMLATSGDLIALSDQDDVWHPDRMQTIVDAFAADPAADLVFSDARLVDANGAPLRHSLFQALSMTPTEKRQLRGGNAFAALLGRNLVTGATVVFRRSLLAVATPFADNWVHDEWLAALAAATGGVRMVDRELIDYRQHGGNQIGAARLTLGQKVGRVSEERTDRNARLLARSQELVARLQREGDRVPSSVLAEARAKEKHEQLRSSLSESRAGRVTRVAGELLGGRYRRYGRGVLDAGRDLLQPGR